MLHHRTKYPNPSEALPQNAQTHITQCKKRLLYYTYLGERKLYDFMRAISTYSLGTNSLIDAILKNQFLHVSLADSGTSLAINLSEYPDSLVPDLKIIN